MGSAMIPPNSTIELLFARPSLVRGEFAPRCSSRNTWTCLSLARLSLIGPAEPDQAGARGALTFSIEPSAVAPDLAPQVNDIVIKGFLLSVDESNAGKCVMI